MIGKVTRGSDVRGLVRYLFGPGDSRGEHPEVHTDQRAVAASEGLDVELGVTLDSEAQRDLAWQMDAPRALHGAEVKDGHVWHLSLSNPAGDRVLSDAEWGRIATETMDALGFTEKGSGRPPCPWVAVRHGQSARGNDHLHVAVSLVREDGTRASVWQDRVKLSRACHGLEERYGLTVVEGREAGGKVGLTRAELERAHVAGREPESTLLAFRVREAAAQVGGEAEFVKRLRSSGVLVRPRYAQGSRDVVEGYSVALRPAAAADRPVWRGGGHLGKDLSLPRLRERWAATATTGLAAEVPPAWKQAAIQSDTELPRQPVRSTFDRRRGAAVGAASMARRLKSSKSKGVVEGLTGDERPRRRRDRDLNRDLDR